MDRFSSLNIFQISFFNQSACLGGPMLHPGHHLHTNQHLYLNAAILRANTAPQAHSTQPHRSYPCPHQTENFESYSMGCSGQSKTIFLPKDNFEVFITYTDIFLCKNDRFSEQFWRNGRVEITYVKN